MFCSEIEVGYFLATILDVLIPYAFGAVAENSFYNIYDDPSGIQVLSFQCSLDHYITRTFLNREFNLVSSENHQVVDFISTEDNPIFLINKAAVVLFEHLRKHLEKLENKVIDKKLFVTGQSLGGYLAILFTLWLHHVIDVKRSSGANITTRPICITFGSPLVGDKALKTAISQRPKWKSSFLSVVSTSDPFACFFLSNTPYKPFGTFLFCTQSGGHTSFEDSDAILAVLDKMASSRSESSCRQMHDYRDELSSMRSNVLYRGSCYLADELNSNTLRAGMALQFKEIGLLDNIPNDVIEKMEGNHHEKKKKSMDAYSEAKKLSEMKIEMAFMEWFISYMRSTGRNYYDCYKSELPREENLLLNKIIEGHRGLNQYWEKFVKEKKLMPQKEGASLRKSWLYSSNNYRKMFEPLYIREYYKNGNTNYIKNRPNRYKLLEKWWDEDRRDLNPNERKEKGPNVNDDSCFWAHVEEALISLRLLTNGSSSTINVDETEQKLDKLMAYVMKAVNNYTLSSDIFLEGSSLMQWWREYNAYKKGLCTSEFAKYMKSGKYRSYQ